MGELKKWNRREFLKRTFLSGGALVAFSALPENIFAALADDFIKLTILHTNDQHSHIDPFPANDPKYPNMGGVARRASLIKKIRAQEKNVLLFDAGDIWQGTPYFNMFGGELEFKLMSEMKYDAATIGNHDLDNGIEGLVKQLPHAQFPFINCNYDFSDTAMNGKTIPYKVFEKEGLKIGVFGLGIELQGLVDKKNYGNIKYLDPIQKSAEYSHLLKKDLKCDLVIALSHLGDRYEDKKVSDAMIAKQSKNIDIFIGGHTHRFYEKPTSIKNSDGEEVLIVQAGFAGIKLGKIDYFFSRKKNKKYAIGSMVKISSN
ncbi:MAG: metallophosphatase [Bacteroidetes bacterium]|nr:metallophosphatase [Bacteroidota bacterium]